MLEEYSRDERKLREKGTLETLRLRSFMEVSSIADVSVGLTVLVYRINEIFPQFPSEFRKDSHKIYYLKKPVKATYFISLTQ